MHQHCWKLHLRLSKVVSLWVSILISRLFVSGYQFDVAMSICVQSGGGCINSGCSFGCNPLGSRGYSCHCPEGYQSVGEGHCISTLNPSGFTSLHDDWDYDEEEEKYISTEGCFSCQMNGYPGRSKKRRKSSRRGTSRRSRRNRRSSERISRKDEFLDTVGVLNFESGKFLSNNITVHLKLSPAQTRHRQRIARFLPSRSDLSHSLDYSIISNPSENLEIKRRGGYWGLFFKRRVESPTQLTAKIVGKLIKGPDSKHDNDLYALFRIEII